MSQKEAIVVRGRRFVHYLSYQEITVAIQKIAQQIERDHGHKNPLFVCIMNGAFMFATELMQALDAGYEVAFARYSSYQGTESTMQLKEVMPVSQSLQDRCVIIVEDLIDTGYTMKCVVERFYQLGAKEVYTTALLSKPEARKCEVQADYIALEIENKFIVGHGLDYDDYGRMYRDIYQLDEN